MIWRLCVEQHEFIFWVILFLSGLGLAASLRQFRSAGNGWTLIYGAILALLGASRIFHKPQLIYAAAGIWLLFVLAPGLASRIYSRFLFQQRIRPAWRLALLISWLHPFASWRKHPRVIWALDLESRGQFEDAIRILREFQNAGSPLAGSAVAHLARMTGQWDIFLAWHAQYGLGHDEPFLPSLLRAYGETGNIHALADLFRRQRDCIAKFTPPESRDFCRLLLFAFCGRRTAVESLLSGPLSILPELTQRFWLATADLAAGKSEIARREFEAIHRRADPALRLAIDRRLAAAPPLLPEDPFVEEVLRTSMRDMAQDDSFAPRRTLFSKRAFATQCLIAANLLMFAATVRQGGATDPYVLTQLGALIPGLVQEGQWWRLVSALFLHFGPLHLAMNMFALWTLGPFAEFALGFRRFVLVYFLCGAGSMAVVLALRPNFIVGASGAVMGLLGATAALSLRSWLQNKAPTAKRRLCVVMMFVVCQTAFDAIVPQVSMTAHLSGAVIGFLCTLGLQNRLPGPSQSSLSSPRGQCEKSSP